MFSLIDHEWSHIFGYTVITAYFVYLYVHAAKGAIHHGLNRQQMTERSTTLRLQLSKYIFSNLKLLLAELGEGLFIKYYFKYFVADRINCQVL